MNTSVFKKAGACVITTIIIAWPFIVWIGVNRQQTHWITPLLLAVMVLRLRKFMPAQGPMRGLVKGGTIIAIVLCSLSLIFRQHFWLMWYPVAINAVMFIVFTGSLWTSMPLIERLARLQKPELPPAAIRHTRNVTRIWSFFFLFNGSVSAATVLSGNVSWWGLWNGVISYGLIGLLIAGEWLLRRWIVK